MPTKPKLGQNFLNDAQAVERIANSLGDLAGRTVVEIGPGAGAITGALAARAGHVLAVELDHELALHLQVQFPEEKVTVIEQDVLHFDFAAASAAAGERLKVVGNLPYYITSQIVLKLAASHASLDRAILMVQREVADRITSGPGSRDYGAAGVVLTAARRAFHRFPLAVCAALCGTWRGREQLSSLCAQGVCAEAKDAGQQPARHRPGSGSRCRSTGTSGY
jgi:16S rRNA (adenine1518-N6/adenine1519-N6)-dimethyltransferase